MIEFNVEALHKIMEKLSEERPFFHSEADFQHALAWKIHEKWKSANIRLELVKRIKRREFTTKEKEMFKENRRKDIEQEMQKLKGKIEKIKNKNMRKRDEELRKKEVLLREKETNKSKNIEKYEGILLEGEQRAEIDLWVVLDKISFAIELKYKKAYKSGAQSGAEFSINQELFTLVNQSAADIGSYDYVKDIERLERVFYTGIPGYLRGYCIILTNDFSYWKPTKSNNREFYPLEESLRSPANKDQFLRGGKTLYWHGDKTPLHLDYIYQCNWKSYSDISDFLSINQQEEQKNFKKLKYLLLEVPNNSVYI